MKYEIIRDKDLTRGYFEYAVSLNPFDKEYILNVLGTKAYDGDAPIFVETLYDVALEQGIANYDVSVIDSGLTEFQVYQTADFDHHEPVYGIVDKPQSSLNRKYVGRRYLASKYAKDEGIRCVCYDYELGRPYTMSEISNGDPDAVVITKKPSSIKEDDAAAWSAKTVAEVAMEVGQIYTVKQYTTQDGKRHYYYAYYSQRKA